MKAKMLMSLVILAALTMLSLASDDKYKGAASSPGKTMLQTCTACEKSIRYKHVSGDNWEILCPTCDQPLTTVQSGTNTFYARCESCQKGLSLEKKPNGTMLVKCPDCGQQMAMKCPDCGNKGKMLYARLESDGARMECSKCHRQIDMK
jgi:predicted RNA-binding Zn-ribbon protein involved in translation (DUF1610 family)